MSRAVGRALVLAAVLVTACESDDVTFPVSPAPTSRHDALRDALTDDARAFSVANGDWLEDQGEAPFYGTAWLARTGQDATPALARARALIASDLATGDNEEKVFAVLGLIENVAASNDQADIAAIDSFLDRLDAVVTAFGNTLDPAPAASWDLGLYGPTAATALVAFAHAQYALLVTSPRTRGHLDRAVALEQALTDVMLTDLVEPVSGRETRGYAFSTQTGALDLLPNATMLLLESRLYRLTRSDTYLLEAHALYGALQPLKLSDTPARYASPEAGMPHIATLASQDYVALALLALFEVTGDQSFVDEADRVLDAIASMRGPWCTADHCTTGLLSEITDGVLPTTGTLFDSGDTLQTLYVLGVRRQLAGESF